MSDEMQLEPEKEDTARPEENTEGSVENSVYETDTSGDGDTRTEESDNATHDDDEFEVEDIGIDNCLKALSELTKGYLPSNLKLIRKLSDHYEHLVAHERDIALNRFITDGGQVDDFEFRMPADYQKFQQQVHEFQRHLRHQINESEKEKSTNLIKKQALLEEFRKLGEEAETKDSFKRFKDLQNQWKTIGAVPKQNASEVWASYHALVDIFYNNRKLYIDLIELDRKKNLELKEQLCDRVRQLLEQPFSNKVLSELNSIHDEFKHIGPVPKEQQEPLWETFKGLSDQLYEKKKEFNQKNLEQQEANAVVKQGLLAQLNEILGKEPHTAGAWNESIQEVLKLGEAWKKAGPLPKDKVNEFNRQFWSGYKAFFQHKNTFFKTLDKEKSANLKLKISLCERIESLPIDEWEQNLDVVKEAQQSWRAIGPIPVKHRDKMQDRFTKACDPFFQKRRLQQEGQQQEFIENLKKKEDLCSRIEAASGSEATDTKALIDAFKSEWDAIGFVPSKDKGAIYARFKTALDKLLEAGGLNKQEARQYKFELELSEIKKDPDASNQAVKKEQALKKKMASLEEEAALLRNNLALFSRPSNAANSLLSGYQQKLGSLESEIQTIKDQLSALRKI